MAIRAHTKLPCIRIIQTNGVAVGHIQRYRRIGPTESPFTQK